MIDPAELLRTRFGVAAEEIEKARTYQRKYGGQLEQILISLGAAASEMLPEFYAELLDLPLILQIPDNDWTLPDAAHQLPLDALLAKLWIPYQFDDKGWLFYTATPLDAEAQELIAGLQVPVSLTLLPAEQLATLKLLAAQTQEQNRLESLSSHEEARLRELASEAPTVHLLNSLITRALKLRASDMHVEPEHGRARVRLRIDGVLQEIEQISASLVMPLITRLKILSNMDIAEKRRPQDGKIEMRISGVDLDIRVSCLPLNDGESVVMRFLRKDSIRYDMATLGISADLEKLIQEDLQRTAGVILLTGPTGSGKTTSLYTFLHQLNSPEVKIITLEDPVEYQLDGVNQVQVQPDIGFDFAAGLRSVVRQDPDIVMLGEIRDRETASIAMQSALTGHLVFSTVHTNDAPSAFTRLLDLGVDEFLLNAALISIVAQRLVRKLCDHCAEPDTAALEPKFAAQLAEVASQAGVAELNLRKACGCEHCNFSGYRGRVAIIEYLRCDEAIQSLPKDQNFILAARKLNQQRGGRTLLSDGFLKVALGVTTLDEVRRAAS